MKLFAFYAARSSPLGTFLRLLILLVALGLIFPRVVAMVGDALATHFTDPTGNRPAGDVQQVTAAPMVGPLQRLESIVRQLVEGLGGFSPGG